MFGLPHDSHKEFHPLLIYYSKQARQGLGSAERSMAAPNAGLKCQQLQLSL